MDNWIGNSITQELWQLPLLLVYLVGILISLALRKRGPTAATCAAIGLFLLLFADACSPICGNYIISSQLRRNWNNLDVNHALTIVSVILNIIRTGAFVLIIVAIFSGRQRQAVADFNTRRI
ncbi:MAG TPA: hypothetical protein VFC63_12790 [Blastocatellia bacterium]|nr:hypothetical protein [Blastocatellia bacterium]